MTTTLRKLWHALQSAKIQRDIALWIVVLAVAAESVRPVGAWNDTANLLSDALYVIAMLIRLLPASL